MRWFLLRGFANLVSLYSLLVISKNHSNIFLLIILQKTELNQSRILKKGCCLLPDIYFNNMQINKFFKDIFFTEHLWMAASKTRRISFRRSFFVSLDKSALLRCRCFFSEILILVRRKIFSAFYWISHEAFPNSCVSLLCKN